MVRSPHILLRLRRSAGAAYHGRGNGQDVLDIGGISRWWAQGCSLYRRSSLARQEEQSPHCYCWWTPGGWWSRRLLMGQPLGLNRQTIDSTAPSAALGHNPWSNCNINRSLPSNSSPLCASGSHNEDVSFPLATRCRCPPCFGSPSCVSDSHNGAISFHVDSSSSFPRGVVPVLV